MSQINRFQVAVKRIESTADYDGSDFSEPKTPYGYYSGRAIIGEQNGINGGVFIGAIPHEAIVVDEEYESLKYCYDQLLTKFATDHGRNKDLENKIIPYIEKLVDSKIRYSIRGVSDLLERKNIENDRKTSLSFFIERGIGAARHKVLLYAYLIERLKKSGYLSGPLILDATPSNQLEEDEGVIYITPNNYRYSYYPGLS